MKENKTELITNLIQENSKVSDVIGTVKSAKNIKITPNSFSFVKCKQKSNVIGKKKQFQLSFNRRLIWLRTNSHRKSSYTKPLEVQIN